MRVCGKVNAKNSFGGYGAPPLFHGVLSNGAFTLIAIDNPLVPHKLNEQGAAARHLSSLQLIGASEALNGPQSMLGDFAFGLNFDLMA